MEASEIVDNYTKKHKDLPTLTLAKLIYKDYPKHFMSVESIRTMIRYRRGNCGEMKKNKAKANYQETFRKNGVAGYKIPTSDAKPVKDYKLKEGNWLLLSDIHIPYHNVEAIDIALDYADNNQVDHILLNGDTCDFYNVSAYNKDPDERNLSNELQKTRQFLSHLRERYPNADIIYKIGNHEDRWEKYLINKAPELLGISQFEMQHILNFDKYDVTLVKSMQKIKAGKHLTILHGHETRNSGVYPARTLLTRTKVCSIAGHNHRTSTYGEKTSDDKYLYSWTLGCLCDMKPDYMPINQWNHGFGWLTLKGNDFTVKNLRIINGEIK